jgi:hypothetical protein
VNASYSVGVFNVNASHFVCVFYVNPIHSVCECHAENIIATYVPIFVKTKNWLILFKIEVKKPFLFDPITGKKLIKRITVTFM